MGRSAKAVTRRSSVGRGSAVELPDVIDLLREHLGTQLLALTIDVNPRTVTRWASEQDRHPHFGTEIRLRAAFQVFQELQSAEAPSTIRAWFMGMNPQLDDRSPAEAIRDGDAKDAMAAARSFTRAD